MMVNFGPTEFAFLLTLGAVAAVVLAHRGRSRPYLALFVISWFYVILVISIVVYPIVPETPAEVGFVWPAVNLFPLNFGDCQVAVQCVREALSNILLTVPAGIFLPLLAQLRRRQVAIAAVLVGVLLEALQYTLSLAFGSRFRIADINDVILNAIGVLVGYGILLLFAQLILGRCGHAIRPTGGWLCQIVRRSANALGIAELGDQKRA